MLRIYEKAFLGEKIVSLEEAKLSVASSAVLYGLSVYTVLPIVHTKDGAAAFRLADHFDRLINSSRIIGIDTFEKNWTYEKFEKVLTDVVRANSLKENVFARITVHVDELVPGTRSRELSTTLSIFLYEAKPIVPQNGVRLMTSRWQRVSDRAIPPRAKVNSAYVNSVLAKQEAIDAGFDDALFLNVVGNISELSAANIFLVKDSVLITPDTASDILEGITRRTILEIAKEEEIKIEERSVQPSELTEADEAFASGTSSFVAHIKEIDGKIIGKGVLGPVTSMLQKKYFELLKGQSVASKKYLTNL